MDHDRENRMATAATTNEAEPQPTDPKEPDKRGAERHRRIIDELYKIFDFINHHVFVDELHDPVISLQVGKRGPRQTCWCSEQQVWRNLEDVAPLYFEICYHAELINRPVKELISDMLHQMVHIWNAQNGYKDNCRNGTYHNNLYKAAAESHGLTCTVKSKKDGFSEVELPHELLQEVLVLINEDAFSISREEIQREKKPKEKKTPSPIHDFKERLNEAIKAKYASADDAGACDIAKFAATLCKEIIAKELETQKEQHQATMDNANELHMLDNIFSDVVSVATPETATPTKKTSIHELVTTQLKMTLVSCPNCGTKAFAAQDATLICANCNEEMADD